jgi:hypothetical protein
VDEQDARRSRNVNRFDEARRPQRTGTGRIDERAAADAACNFLRDLPDGFRNARLGPGLAPELVEVVQRVLSMPQSSSPNSISTVVWAKASPRRTS